MNPISVISFTERGRKLSLQIKKLCGDDKKIDLFVKSKHAYTEKDSVKYCRESIAEWTKKQFQRNHEILFIGACAIAVRAIAPSIRDKLTDVPVLVMDELGNYIIPILSGHYGGANELADFFSGKTGAEAVITTATDINRKFAVDVFARQNNLIICSRKGIKEVSSSILAGKKVTMVSEGSISGRIPDELTILKYGEYDDLSILISLQQKKDWNPNLWLCPKAVVVGIGCRKGKTFAEIEAFVKKHLNLLHIPIAAAVCISSIEEKRMEPGLCAFAEKYNVRFLTYTADDLNQQKGTYTASAFVKQKMGVDNICERAAMAAAGKGACLLLRKQAENGITLAVARKKWGIHFDETFDYDCRNRSGKRGYDEHSGIPCSGRM